jgi:succinoglycan biosynthesis transport protein ExoP
MSNEMQQQITPFDGYGSEMVEYQPPGGNRALGGVAPDAVEQPKLMKKIHQSLRGRYWIGLVLGTILGGVGAYFGWKSQQPVYRGEGLIRIAMNRQIVDPRATDTSGLMANFEEYVQSQAMLITSRTIIDKAITGPNWKDTGLGTEPQVRDFVAANLTVEHPSRTELIRVYYADRSQDVAAAVCKAIVLTYSEFVNTRTSFDDKNRLDVLWKRKSLFASDLAGYDKDIMDAANEMGGGGADLGALLEAKINEETKMESRLHEAELALSAAQRKQDTKQAVNGLSEKQIGMVDAMMRQLLAERESISQDMARLTAAGMLPENVKMKQLRTLLEGQERKIEAYVLEWRDMQFKVAEDPSLAAGGGIPRLMQMSEKWLQGEVEILKKKYEEAHQARISIGQKMLRMQELQRKRETAQKEVDGLQQRINALSANEGVAGRLTVIDSGSVPVAPYKDRRKMFGAAGALGGFGLPMGLLVMLGLLDKRYRYSDETNDGVSNVPLLGILPRLPDHLSDPEQAAVAAHCIHQIRIMLQVGQNPDKRRAFMVTSASTGDGKTSLTMALGLSFAASGSKTLVIDCDMVGQGLTHRLKAANVPGLIETLNLGTLRGHVRKTATKGLYILPIGNADAVHAGVLSPQSIKRLMTACREHFDIVVIDTGPILGSLEASVVAAEVDGVIVAVARGQQQPLVEKAIKHLRAIGANLFGIVFNRAEQRDFQRSVTSASIRSMSAKPAEPRALLPESDESSRFGPLARSVASCLPASSSNGNGHANGNGNGHGHGNGEGGA